MKCAPIVIPTLCRYNHLRDCIESLSKCKFANITDVYLCIDYPAKQEHYEGYYKINEYLSTVELPFNKLVIIKRERNYGEYENLVSVYNDCIKNNYESWILTEDDNVFSPNFLDYINKNLERYANDPSIYAVCGYSYTFVQSKGDAIYRSYLYSPWGVGFWVDKFRVESQNEVDSYLYNGSHVLKLLRVSPYVLETIISMAYANKIFGDAITRARLILEGKSCIFPTISKVKNCGFDNSGINCTDDGGMHLSQLIDINDEYISEREVIIKDINQLINSYFRIGGYTWMKSVMKYIILLMKHFSLRVLYVLRR